FAAERAVFGVPRIAGIVDEEIEPGEGDGCETPYAQSDKDPGEGVDPAVEEARERGVDEYDAAEQLAFHFLTEVDVAGTKGQAARYAMPGFAGHGAPGRRKDPADGQHDKCGDAEHPELIHDPVDDVGYVNRFGGGVVQAERDPHERWQRGDLFQVVMAAKIAAAY